MGRLELDNRLTPEAQIYRGKTILVTGAGGSVGSELCRQLLLSSPRKILLLDHSELSLFAIDNQLRDGFAWSRTDVIPILGSVTDDRLLARVLDEHGVDVIFHAAAYKHVPMVERNPLVGLQNNVFGTKTLADAARRARVGRFILISTDKAIDPASIMGVSKRLAELVVQDLASRSDKTLFSIVRFGNVLGSSGSVIPIFEDQIARGGPLTLTDEGSTRFFMSLREAAQLVLAAGCFSRGGEVFALQMGKPVPIRELAQKLIEACGLSVRDRDHPDGSIEIVTIGLRPGEKLHEVPLIGCDSLRTPHPKILVTREAALSEPELAGILNELRIAIDAGDVALARACVSQWLGDFSPATPVATTA